MADFGGTFALYRESFLYKIASVSLFFVKTNVILYLKIRNQNRRVIFA